MRGPYHFYLLSVPPSSLLVQTLPEDARAVLADEGPHGGVGDLAPDLANVTWADIEAVSPFVWARATALARSHGYDV